MAGMARLARHRSKTKAGIDTASLQSLVEILGVSGRKVVETDDCLSERQETLEQVRSNESSDTRDEPGAGILSEIRLSGLESFHLEDVGQDLAGKRHLMLRREAD